MPNIKNSGTKKLKDLPVPRRRAAVDARRFFGVFAAALLFVVVIFLIRFAIFIFHRRKDQKS
jgi:hypothetical protein